MKTKILAIFCICLAFISLFQGKAMTWVLEILKGLPFINNTITCNNGEEIEEKSTKDLGNYDQMLDDTDLAM